MSHLIVLAGAPGSGKTTICERLHQRFQSVLIDFGCLRVFHLDPEWKKANPVEEQMAFDNLTFILRNYIRHGYPYILVTDLRDHRVQQIPDLFAGDRLTIVTLLVHDEDEHRRRVLDPDRDSGYRDYESAIAWNRSLVARPSVTNEFKFDNTKLTPQAASQQIEKLILARDEG